QFGGAFQDRKLAAYVRKLGLALAKTSERPDLPWTFTVLNDTQINAFALPGGYIYVTRGLLALASDKAELAGVLSHEIGHVTARHTAQRYSSTMAANIGVNILGVLSQAAGLGRIGGDLASLGASAALKGYSRGQELESDMLGARYMRNLRYDSTALISFFEKLKIHQQIESLKAGKDANSADSIGIFATHPRTADRITQAIEMAGENANDNSRRDADEYLNQINGLVFGDDDREGLVRGRVFIHPSLGIRFKVPEGFTLKNNPGSVVATHENGTKITFAAAAAKDVREAGGLEKYLIDKRSNGYSMGEVEWLDINGMKAVTAEAKVWSGLSNTTVRRVVVERDRNTYWRFQFEIPSGDSEKMQESLRRTTYSLRPPTRAEKAEAKSWRVRVVRVSPGVTYDDMVQAMAVPKFKEKWFQALNNLNPGDPLPLGKRIKLIK
ncbi:MAG: M48 family metalloprotease, partial [Magnetovibrio sp.]|nr:M48 family metalloprotease [Magnetovibrio sp.]